MGAVGRALACAAFALAACGRAGPAPSPATPAPVAAPAESPKPPPMVPLAPGGPRAPRVGGCSTGCAEPGAAMAGFLAATAAAPCDPAAVAAYLDSTRLVVDDRDLGTRWAGLARDVRFATRSEEVRDAASSLCDWMRGAAVDRVRETLAAGARPLRTWSTEATFELTVPAGPAWVVTLRPRGQEWLVTEIRRGGAPDGPTGDAR